MWKGAFYGGVYGHTIKSTIPSWVPLSSNVAIETRLPSSAILRALSEASGPIPPPKKTPKWSHILRNPLLNYGFLGVFDVRAVRRMGPQYMSSALRKTSFCPLNFHPWLLQSPACFGAKLGAQKKMHGWTLEMNSTDLALDGWFPGFDSQISCLGLQVFFRWDPKIGAYSQDFDSVFPSFLGSTLKKKQFWSPDVHSPAQRSCFGSTARISWDLLQGPPKNPQHLICPKKIPQVVHFPLGKCPKTSSSTPQIKFRQLWRFFLTMFGGFTNFHLLGGLQNGIPSSHHQWIGAQLGAARDLRLGAVLWGELAPHLFRLVVAHLGHLGGSADHQKREAYHYYIISIIFVYGNPILVYGNIPSKNGELELI